MAEAEAELYKCGVPVKTRHNEVAPWQYEIAPIFESANVATDHQMMTMETLKRVAPKYGLACLLHEKPFAGVNGSGKHLNWSIGDDLGNNLLNPGDTPHDNMQFLFFCMAVIRAVDTWQGLLRMSIAHAGNDHRLGANEAPPAILSVFLGDMLTDIFEQVESGGAKSTKAGGVLDIGVSVLPKLPRDAGDRNRTSPFAFTGNKFEFRAVGSTQNVAFPATCLNVAVAESLDALATELEARAGEGPGARGRGRGAAEEDHQAAQAHHLQRQRLLGGMAEGSRQARAAEPEEHGRRAARDRQAATWSRRSRSSRCSPKRELHARYEVNLETYCKTINVEAQLMVLMANRYILPAALEYQRRVAESVAAVKAAGAPSKEGKKLLDRTRQARRPVPGADRQAGGRARAPSASTEKHAKYMRDTVVPEMATLRDLGDQIELIIPHELWPLPTYREMLFIK